MRRRDGFLLIEALAALAILSAAILSAGQAFATARLAAARRHALQAIADCAGGRLVMTMIGPAAPAFACAGARAELDGALAGGDVEDVVWRISAGVAGPESFETVRYAR